MKLFTKIIIIPIAICIVALGLLGYLVTVEMTSKAEKNLKDRAEWIAVLFDADVTSMDDVFTSGQKLINKLVEKEPDIVEFNLNGPVYRQSKIETHRILASNNPALLWNPIAPEIEKAMRKGGSIVYNQKDQETYIEKIYTPVHVDEEVIGVLEIQFGHIDPSVGQGFEKVLMVAKIFDNILVSKKDLSDAVLLQKLVATMVENNPNIAVMNFYGPTYKNPTITGYQTIASNSPANLGRPCAEDSIRPIVSHTVAMNNISRGGKRFLKIVAPVYVDRKTVASIDILFSYARAQKEVDKSISTFILSILLVVFLIGLFLFVIINKFAVIPILKLKRAAMAIAGGNMSERVDIRSDDEIGLLSSAFNEMGESLAQSTVSIKVFEEERKRFQDIAGTSGDWIWESDEAGRYTYSNSEVEKILGYTRDEIIGKNIADIFDDKRNEEKASRIFDILKSKNEVRNLIDRTTNREGTVVILETTAVAIVDANGKAIGYRGVNRDVTLRKKVEAALRQERDKAQKYLDIASVIILAIDPQGEVILINKKGCEVLGYNEDEIVGKNWVEHFIPAGSHDLIKRIAEEIFAGVTDQHSYFENLIVTKKGQERLIAWNNKVVRDASGAIIGCLSSGEDITVRKQAEEQLQETLVNLKRHNELMLGREERIIELKEIINDLQGKLGMSPLFDNNAESDAKLQFIYKGNDAYRKNGSIVQNSGAPSKTQEFDFKTAGRSDGQSPKASLTRNDASETVDQILNRMITRLGEASSEIYANPVEAHGSGASNPLPVLLEETIRDLRSAQASLSEQKDQLESHIRARTEELKQSQRIILSMIEDAEAAKLEAQNANQAKSEFLANMSHEIRTPMNGVMGMTSILMQTSLTSDQLEYAATIQSSADALLTIINDILDFSKIEAGKLEFEILDFDIFSTVEDVTEMMALKANQKGLEFACMIHEDVPLFLKGDPGRLRQILINLSNNAIKFTEQGQVTIQVQVDTDTKTHVLLRFSVADTGIGISPDRTKRLFQKFSQADASITRKYGGTGLGLAISRQLAEMMGGEIGVESQEGNGSTFWFTAHFEKAPRPVVTKKALPESIWTKRILVVDDNAVNRKIICSYLKSMGCEYVSAPNAPEALELLRRNQKLQKPFDMAIIDYIMPEMDGHDLVIAIKADPNLTATKIIMITSRESRRDTSTSDQIGLDAFLTKPIKRAQLQSAILSVLGKEVADNQESAPEAISHNSLLAFQKLNLRVLLAEDNITNQKIALHMLTNFGCTADAVANGEEAVEGFKSLPYDAILMDVQMPVMDGLTASKRIRAWESKLADQNSRPIDHVPIIAMTANAMKGDRDKCLDAGMDDYLPKPVDPEKLYEMLQKWARNG